MENFSDLIRNRRSMRKFTDEELTQDQVLTLLKAALMAPSSKLPTRSPAMCGLKMLPLRQS